MDVFKLLTEIQQYYPIGYPYHNEGYPGYQKIKSIIAEKWDKLNKGEGIEPWHSFVSHLQGLYQDRRILEAGGYLKPSHSIYIPVKESVEVFIKRRTSIHGSLSLLFPYYTLYLKEEFFHEPDEPNHRDPFYSAFIRPDLTQTEMAIFDTVNTALTTYYPEYTHINYNQLRRVIMGAIPIGADPETMVTEYPMFDFIYGYFP